MRDALKAYVDSPLGKVDWQLDHATITQTWLLIGCFFSVLFFLFSFYC